MCRTFEVKCGNSYHALCHGRSRIFADECGIDPSKIKLRLIRVQHDTRGGRFVSRVPTLTWSLPRCRPVSDGGWVRGVGRASQKEIITSWRFFSNPVPIYGPYDDLISQM